MKRIMKKALVYLLLISIMIPVQVRAEELQETKCHAISIALDVSGSMKKTDAKRHSIELIKLFMDLCNETDYLNVTAYNDSIVYHSGLISMGNSVAKTEMINAIDQLQFSGETDNGLGLLAATKAITDATLAYDNAFVILVTDGNTDLENSKTDRTIADSDADMKESASLAKENDITIDVVEYTNAYNQDTGLLSVISVPTGGGATLVDNPPQFIQVMLGIFFSEYLEGKVNQDIEESKEIINRYELAQEMQQGQKRYEFVFSTEEMHDCEVISSKDDMIVHQGEHYVVFEMPESGIYEAKAVYSVSDETEVIKGHVNLTQTVITVEEPVQGTAPQGTECTQKIYTSKDSFSIDVSTMFQDAENDIVAYQVKQVAGDEAYHISGSMLSIDVSKAAFQEYQITAVDSKQNQTTISYFLEVEAAWKQYYSLLLIGLIVLIFVVAAGISAMIIRRVLFHKKEQTAISGYLYARFIDLKSKNETIDIQWNLSEYLPEGVTLEELLHSKRMKENLMDIEKVCFYPGQNVGELTLVYCMEGSIFLGEQLLAKNTPIRICSGDILYVSFAENASELELRYQSA